MSENKNKLSIIITIIVVLIILIGGFFAYKNFKNKTSIAPEDSFTQGIQLMEQGDYESALPHFKKSIEEFPDRPKYYKAAIHTALKLDNKTEAKKYAESGWKMGLKDEQTLKVIASGYLSNNDSNGLKNTLNLLDELPAGKNREQMRGHFNYVFGNKEEGINIWLKLIENDPDSSLINNVAAIFLANKDFGKAKNLIIKHKDSGHLNEYSYKLLTGIYIFHDKYRAAEESFDEAKTKNIYSDLLQLQHGIYYILKLDLAKALELLEPLKNTVSDTKLNYIRRNARIALAYIYYTNKDMDSIDKLMEIATSSSVKNSSAGELIYFKAVKSIDENNSKALNDLHKAKSSLPNQNFIELFTARATVKAGKYDEALNLYKKIDGPMSVWPVVLYEMAETYYLQNLYNESIEVISNLHSRNLYSKRSLILYRNAALKLNRLDITDNTQNILEKKYPDDPYIKMTGGMLAIDRGNYEKAEKVFEDLSKNFPDEIENKFNDIESKINTGSSDSEKSSRLLLKVLKFNLSVYTKKFDAAESYLNKIKDTLTEENYAVLYTVLNIVKNDEKKAIAFLENTKLSKDKWSSLAEKANEFKQAKVSAYCYKKVLEKEPENPVYLNNFAWQSLLDPDLKINDDIINAAKKAYKVAPGNSTIIDTYSVALIKAEKYQECEKVLTDNMTVVKKTPQLLYNLARLYESKKDNTKALKNYQKCLNLSSSQEVWPIRMSKEVLVKHVESLKQAK